MVGTAPALITAAPVEPEVACFDELLFPPPPVFLSTDPYEETFALMLCLLLVVVPVLYCACIWDEKPGEVEERDGIPFPFDIGGVGVPDNAGGTPVAAGLGNTTEADDIGEWARSGTTELVEI